MLYGFKNDLTTFVVAYTNEQMYRAWYQGAIQASPLNFAENWETDIFEHLMDDDLKDFKRTIYGFKHTSVEQQEAFIAEHQINILKRRQSADKQIDMVNYDALDEYKEGVDNRTLAEIGGVVNEDPWDKRSAEEILRDEEIKKEMQKRQETGEISGDSFAPRKPSTREKDVTIVEDVGITINDDGTWKVNDIRGTKINPNQVAAEKAGEEIPTGDVGASAAGVETHVRDDARTGKVRKIWGVGKSATGNDLDESSKQ